MKLQQYEMYFSSKDSSIISFVGFAGRDTCLEMHAFNMYSAYYRNDFDTADYQKHKNRLRGSLNPLEYITLIDTNKILCAGDNIYYMNKLSNGIYRIYNQREESIISISFKIDSLVFSSIDSDSILSSYSIPAIVEPGKYYMDNRFTVLREESLGFSGIKVSTLVIRYQPKLSNVNNQETYYWDIWVSPKHFIVKAKMVSSQYETHIMLRRKEEL